MTVKEIYEKAEWKLDHNEITIGEFEKLVDMEVVEPKWIMFKDMMPPRGERVLCCWDTGYISILAMRNVDDYEEWTRVYMRNGLVAWMPLPPISESILGIIDMKNAKYTLDCAWK